MSHFAGLFGEAYEGTAINRCVMHGAIAVLLVGAVIAQGAVACVPAEIDNGPNPSSELISAPAGDAGGESTCEEEEDNPTANVEAAPKKSEKAGIDVDIATLTACCEDKGKAHCVPDNKLQSSSKEKLEACPSGGFCTPDSLIEGKPPVTCKSTLGEGICLSACIKAVGDKASFLSQETCAAGELCAPCAVGGKPTGACEIGQGGSSTTPTSSSSSASASDAGPKKKCAKKDAGPAGPAPPPAQSQPPAKDAGAPTLAACCEQKGQCVPESLVPEDRKDQLEAKTCASGQLCAPKENIDPSFKPKKCTGDTKWGSEYEGVCLSTCLKFDFMQSFVSEQGSCDEDHRCLPCKVFGRPSGAPGCE